MVAWGACSFSAPRRLVMMVGRCTFVLYRRMKLVSVVAMRGAAPAVGRWCGWGWAGDDVIMFLFVVVLVLA